MGDGRVAPQELSACLPFYLQSWGLREFHDEDAYYEWQRETLSPQDLRLLHTLVEQRQGGENKQADIQFYDVLATPPFLPVLYSQRFDYFRQTALVLSPRLSSASNVLDFGCGVGILVCLLAQQHPETYFVGVDRSARSLETAQSYAKKNQISNIRFIMSSDWKISPVDSYDCIVSTQALFQSECEPGLPSRNWRTFKRDQILLRQEELENRTGLKQRLDRLLRMLAPEGRLICYEKTWNLGRRILFQRALSARQLFPVCTPVLCSYKELGEAKSDGPLFEVSRSTGPAFVAWNEDPYIVEGESLYRCVGDLATRMSQAVDTHQHQKAVHGQHGKYGSWSFTIGLWEEVLAWGFCETESGFRGMLLGSVRDQDLIAQLLNKIKNGTSRVFEEFLQSGWDNVEMNVQGTSSPGYENHFSSAAGIYEALPQKIIQQEATFSEGPGREMHIEMGQTLKFRYLYWANTFDQRQLILVDDSGMEMLNNYYLESIQAAQESA